MKKLMFPALLEELRRDDGEGKKQPNAGLQQTFTFQDNTDVSSRTRGVFFDKLSFSSTDVEQKLLKPNSTCPTPEESSSELSWDLQTFAQIRKLAVLDINVTF